MCRNPGVLVVLLCVALSANASTYVVDDPGDASDAVTGDDACATAGGVCTLRAAIEEANAHAGADTIAFSVAGTLMPVSDYPVIVQQTIIDGRTAPGYDGTPVVAIGRAARAGEGLVFGTGSNGSYLYALRIFGFDTGVTIHADAVTIRNARLGGLFRSDYLPSPPPTNGVGLRVNGSGSTIGGVDGEGNVIVANDSDGIVITGSNHVISDNFIGTNHAGDEDLENGGDGIKIAGGTGVFIGAAGPGAENVISDNGGHGINVDDGSGNTIAGNFIGTNADGTASEGGFLDEGDDVFVRSPGNIIGTPSGRNLICGGGSLGFGGIEVVAGASDTLIQNNYMCVDVTGTYDIGEDLSFGIIVTAENVVIGGTGPSERNIALFTFSGVSLAGVHSGRIIGNIIGYTLNAGIELDDTSGITVASNIVIGAGYINFPSAPGISDRHGKGNVFELNRIGTPDGTISRTSGTAGILLEGTVGAIVRSNQISGNSDSSETIATVGIELTAGADGTIIHSNNIGLSSDLVTPLPNGGDGIRLSADVVNTVIGSAALGGNIIASNQGNGIRIDAGALANNTWEANEIYGNALLGVDIGGDGVTPNDPDDPDAGPNGRQNFPALTAARTTDAGTEITGSIDTHPNTAFTIHFYSSPSADPSGFGEGRTYLGATSGTTDANGDAAFTFNAPPRPAGHVVTATATTSDGTSEFSAAIGVTVPAADLSMTKTTTVTTFVPGQQVTWTLAIANAGPDAATTITVIDVLPAGATFVSATGDDAICTGTSTVICTIATLAAGATTSVALIVTANGNAPISNTASVAAASPADPTPANATSTSTISPAAAAGADIPTASRWTLLLLSLLLASIAVRRAFP
jgi:uncharacterized repeat protein (TIGR01451 family)/CSLREA domain-containing protein